MANNIGGFDNRPVRTGADRQVERADVRATAGQTTAAAPADSSVTLTDAAKRLAALQQAVAAVPDMDMARVEELRNAIASGRYTVDAERITTRLLDIERELASVTRPAR